MDLNKQPPDKVIEFIHGAVGVPWLAMNSEEDEITILLKHFCQDVSNAEERRKALKALTWDLASKWEEIGDITEDELLRAVIWLSFGTVFEPETRNAQELDNLYSNWSNDPCWDLERTAGYERYYDELLEFRLNYEEKERAGIKHRQETRATLLNCSVELVQELERLKAAIDKIDQDLNKILEYRLR